MSGSCPKMNDYGLAAAQESYDRKEPPEPLDGFAKESEDEDG